MPEVRLNKLGSFSMAQLGQSKSAIAGHEEAKEAGAGFQDAMLKLLNTLHCSQVLRWRRRKMRAAMLSFQYWLGGARTTSGISMLADKYVSLLRGR